MAVNRSVGALRIESAQVSVVQRNVTQRPRPFVVNARQAERERIGDRSRAECGDPSLAVSRLLDEKIRRRRAAGPTRDDVDDASRSIAARQRRLRASEDLDSLDIAQLVGEGGEGRLRNVIDDDTSLRLDADRVRE